MQEYSEGSNRSIFVWWEEDLWWILREYFRYSIRFFLDRVYKCSLLDLLGKLRYNPKLKNNNLYTYTLYRRYIDDYNHYATSTFIKFNSKWIKLSVLTFNLKFLSVLHCLRVKSSQAHFPSLKWNDFHERTMTFYIQHCFSTFKRCHFNISAITRIASYIQNEFRSLFPLLEGI